MVTVKCSACRGQKHYMLGDMKCKCPQCMGTGTEIHDTVADAVATETKKTRQRKPKSNQLEVVANELEPNVSSNQKEAAS